ncbi:MAG: DUF4013 domain-containing protein [Candidatus Aenigmarchaeota archaeon]|nr:DUF4013 domain-containing protein [Candidatus Aenigmarchaeota archaeon]
MKYEEALMKPFTDLKKLAIGIILSIIPIVNFTIVTGFAMESSGLGKAKASSKMPEWKDWTYLFMKGLGAFVIKLVYMIPAIAFIAIGVGIAVSDIVGAMVGTVSPEMLGQAVGSQVAANSQLAQVLAQNWMLLLPGLLEAAPLIMVGILLALFAAFLTPIAVLNYLSKRKFSAAFDFGVIVHKSLTSTYVMAWLAMLVVSIVVGAVLGFIPVLGQAITMFLLSVMSYGLYGQAFKEAK